MSIDIVQFPPQKISTSEKSDTWIKKCIDAVLVLTSDEASAIRSSMTNKSNNYDLANGKINEEEIERIFNPMGIKNAVIPAKIQNYPIEKSKFDLLIGEELSRRFDWNIICRNSDAISKKEETLKEDFAQLIMTEIQDPNFDPEKAKKRIENIQKYYKYDYQDYREIMANRVLSYLWDEQDMRMMFNRGFYDVLIGAEEIYCCDIVAGEPIVRKCDPLTVYTLRRNNSNRIEDSDIIIEDVYMSVGAVIDNFYEYLKPGEIDKLEKGYEGSTNQIGNPKFIPYGIMGGIQNEYESGKNLITVDGVGCGSPYDSEGNVRVTRVKWLSRRKIGKLSYYDKDGQKQEKIVDEKYRPNIARGEEIEWKWVNEWWEGTKISDDIYVRLGPSKVQIRKMTNLSYCHPGYVGSIYNINSSQAMSLMDRVKPYKYQYNIYARKLELAISRFNGPIIELDLAKVPNDWDMDLWMYYAEIMGYAVVDSFSEGQRGFSKGKLAGSFNTTGKILNPDMGNFIQQMIMILEKIKNDISEITGVSKQREGQIDNRETVRGVERSVTQSSHITEVYFSLHDSTKIRVMECLLEYAKEAWKHGTRKLDYIDDGLIKNLFEIDGENFKESEYGLFGNNSGNDRELMSLLKDYAFAAMQNDKANLSDVAKMYQDKSIHRIVKDLEAAEASAKEQAQQEQQAALQQQQMLVEQARQDKLNELTVKERIEDKKNQTQMAIAQMKNFKDRDLDNDGVEDTIELDKLKIQTDVEREKLEHEAAENEKDRKHESNEADKDRRSAEKISRNRGGTKKV